MNRRGFILCIGKTYEVNLVMDKGPGREEELEWKELGGAAPLTAIRLQDLGRNARLWTSFGERNRFAEEILSRHMVEARYIRYTEREKEIGKMGIRIPHDSRKYEKKILIPAPNIHLDLEAYEDYENTRAVFICNLLEFDKLELQELVRGLKAFKERGVPVFAAMEIDFFEARIELIQFVFPLLDHLILHFSTQAGSDDRFENMLHHTESLYKGELVIDTGVANDGVCFYRTNRGTSLGICGMRFEPKNCYGEESVFNAYYVGAILGGRSVENALFRARNAAIKSCEQIHMEKLRESEFMMIPSDTLRNVMKIGPTFVSIRQACIERYPGNLLGWIGIRRDYPYVIRLNALNPQQIEGIEAVIGELLDEERLLVEALFKKRICFEELWRYTAYRQLEERKYSLITPENMEIILNNARKFFQRKENIAAIIWGIEGGAAYRKMYMHAESSLTQEQKGQGLTGAPQTAFREETGSILPEQGLSRRALGVLRRGGIQTQEQLLALLRSRNRKKKLMEMRGMGEVLYNEILEKMKERI